VWQQGQAYEPIFSLQSQSQWAFTALVVALSLTGLFILSGTSVPRSNKSSAFTFFLSSGQEILMVV
jgi:hypothetical protein